MNLSSQQILKRWNILIEFIEQHFEGKQKENILKLYKHFEERMIDAPASSRPHHHNCFVGGYLDHVVRVTKTALDIKKQFEKIDVEVITTDADIVLAAMFHDLGKLGDLENPYYITQTDEWRRKKLKEWYTFNDKLEPLSVTDRALWLLQHFDIKISPEVWKAIKLSDGMFDQGNHALYKRPDVNRNILHYIIHFADWMSTIAEKQHYQQSIEISEDKLFKVDKSFEKKKTDNNDKKHLNDLKKQFDKLFETEAS